MNREEAIAKGKPVNETLHSMKRRSPWERKYLRSFCFCARFCFRSFTILHDLEVDGRKCQAVGNRFLLDIPDKVAVIVHRRYTEEDNARLRNEWL